MARADRFQHLIHAPDAPNSKAARPRGRIDAGAAPPVADWNAENIDR
jgi:hypothetical protein